MKKLFLLLATFGFLVTPIVSAFGQAAAESALINGMSSTATVKAGSELNHALDHGMNQLGGRVQQSTSGLAQPGLQQRPTGAAKGTTTCHAIPQHSPARFHASLWRHHDTGWQAYLYSAQPRQSGVRSQDSRDISQQL